MKYLIERILNTPISIKRKENPVHDFYSNKKSSEKKKVYIEALKAAQQEQLLILNH